MLRKNRKFFQKIVCYLYLDRILGYLGRHQIFMRLVYFLAPDPEFYKPSTVRKINFRGLEFFVKMNDMASWANYFGFFTEDIDCLRIIIPATSSDKIILDVGANNGRWALLISNFLKFSRIECFEPFPKTFEFLQENINLNKNIKKEIYTHQFALGSQQGQFFMESDHIQNSGMNKISNIKTDYQILVKTIDSFLIDQTNPAVSVIKIDVEGYEMEVLRGAKETLNKYHPAIVCEIDDSLLQINNSSPYEIFIFLEQLGYQIYKLPRFEILKSSDILKNIHIDILALKN